MLSETLRKLNESGVLVALCLVLLVVLVCLELVNNEGLKTDWNEARYMSRRDDTGSSDPPYSGPYGDALVGPPRPAPMPVAQDSVEGIVDRNDPATLEAQLSESALRSKALRGD